MGFSRVVEVGTTRSTNADLMAALGAEPAQWPDVSVLVARRQTAGRGRVGREWVTPAAGALTCSVVLDPREALPPSWVPLLVGLAMRRALAAWVPVGLKWPNDLVTAETSPDPAWGWGRKVGGILCELHPSGRVVAGIGVNCRQAGAELPVPWAASLASVMGDAAAPAPADVLVALGESLDQVLEDWRADPAAVRAEYAGACVTLGERVRVERPGGGVVAGVARAIDTDGALLVEGEDGAVRVVDVGDVHRVR